MRPFCYPVPGRSEQRFQIRQQHELGQANNASKHEVRSAPINGHRLRGAARPISAINGDPAHMAAQGPCVPTWLLCFPRAHGRPHSGPRRGCYWVL